jgi:Winged helix DNA-binding domain
MTAADLIAQRLHNQLLARTAARAPEDVVSWIGAVQSQDAIGAKWALGLRSRGVTDAEVDRALDEGRILRTHILRPTWHFVTPADIRWMQALTAPRVHRFSGTYYRKHELDDDVFARCHKTIARALEGGRHLTRGELQAALQKAKIETDNLRLGLIVMHAELSALICNGARRGKQATYALLDERVERVATTRAPSREEARAALTRRYVTSHGPITVRDFSWWSGLSMRDAKAGLESIASELAQHVLDDRIYWSLASQPPPTPRRSRRSRSSSSNTAWLMPNYDEYFIAYKDRDSSGRPEFAHLLTIDGRLAGSWKRTFGARAAGVELKTFRPLTKAERIAVDDAVERYAAFLGVPVALSYV